MAPENIFSRIRKLFTSLSEGFAALMLAVMFSVFLLQIFARYVLKDPYSWTPELCLTLWVWIVFFGSGFILQNRHQVTFDIFYLIAPPPVKRVMVMLSAVAIVVGMGMVLLPSYEYVQWLKIKKSATLKVPMRSLFSVYVIFVVAVMVRYTWEFIRSLRGIPEKENSLHHYGDN